MPSPVLLRPVPYSSVGAHCSAHVVAVRQPFQSLTGDVSGLLVHARPRRAATGANAAHNRPFRSAISIIFLIISASGASHSHLIGAGDPPERCTDRPVPTTSASAPARSVKCRRVPVDRAARRIARQVWRCR